MDKNIENKKIDELYKIATKTKADTFLSVLGKTYNENLISDYLAFILDKNRNGDLGVAPLNALLKCAESNHQVDENDDIIIEREHCLNGKQKNRIDFLIRVNSSNKTKFCIGIENKIFADERPKQTTDYANELHSSTYNGTEKNIGIFLTPFKTLSEDEKKNGEKAMFRTVTYKHLIAAFPKDIKNSFYMDFMNHIKKHIINDDFLDSDIMFIYNSDKSIAKNILLKQERNEDERLQDIYGKSIALRNRFFDIVENTLHEYLNANIHNYLFTVNRSSFYIQFYNKSWKGNDNDIHFEIIIPYNKGLLFPDCQIFIMLHKEKGKKNINYWRKKLKEKNYETDTTSLGFNKNTAICGTGYSISDIFKGDIKENIYSMLCDFNENFKIDDISTIIDNYLNKQPIPQKFAYPICYNSIKEVRQMKTYEMKWKPAGIVWNSGMRTDIVQANSLEEATNMIEAQAKALGASSVDWFGKRQLS